MPNIYILEEALHALNTKKKIDLFEDLNSVKSHYPQFSEERFMKLISLDPTYVDGSDNPGTYHRWILDRAKTGTLGG